MGAVEATQGRPRKEPCAGRATLAGAGLARDAARRASGAPFGAADLVSSLTAPLRRNRQSSARRRRDGEYGWVATGPFRP